jgi:SPP1 family predicted phage head-tail adaptor
MAELLANRLTERVSILQPVTSTDELGGQVVSWEELASCWAEVRPMSGNRERVVAQQVNSQPGYRVVMRLRSDVTADMRVQWKNRSLAIHSLHERNAMLELLTYEEQV